MKENNLTVTINKPISIVFQFCITPPNSTKWIPGVVKEETSTFPITNGTIYFLTNVKGKISKVKVINIVENKYVEWISEDINYHCSYSLKEVDKNTTELLYREWEDNGEIDGPFTQEVLNKLKQAIEKSFG